jgi:hypothetical protein
MSWSPGVLAISAVAACAEPQCDFETPLNIFPPGPSCPAGSNISPLTPAGLDLELQPIDFDWFPAGTDRDGIDVATGGSAEMTVLGADGAPLQLAYVASSNDPDIVAVGSQSGSSVMLQGGAVPGAACIEVADPETGDPFAGLWVGASRLRSAVVIPAGSFHELIDDEFSGFAFAAGDLEIGVGYLGGYAGTGPRLIAVDATLELARATQTDWQTLEFPNATPGSYAIEANVGSASGSASFDVVDRSIGARLVEQFDDDLPTLACFAAETDTAAFIVGLEWSFTIDGGVGSASDDYTNCIAIPDDGVAHTITAFAGGQSTAITATAQ